MANRVLFCSSVVLGIVHVLVLLQAQLSNLLLTATIVCGVATSVWNHAASSTHAKVADRVMMRVGFLTDLLLVWFAPDPDVWWNCLGALIAAAVLYFVAKLFIKLSCMALAAATSPPPSPVVSYQPRSLKLSPRRLRLPPKHRRHSMLADASHLAAHVSLTYMHVLLVTAYAYAG